MTIVLDLFNAEWRLLAISGFLAILQFCKPSFQKLNVSKYVVLFP